MMLTEKNFDVVGKMEAVSLEEMSAVSLMNRVDTKYLTTAAKLGLVLEDAYRAGYRICEIERHSLHLAYDIKILLRQHHQSLTTYSNTLTVCRRPLGA